MTVKHATEEQIQAYLDGLVGPDYALLSGHIESCEQCRETMLQYHALYGELSDDGDIHLPADFARTVAAGVGSTETTAETEERWSLNLVFTVLLPLLMAAVTVYFLGAESLYAKVGGFGQSMLGHVDEMATDTAAFLRQFGLRPDLVLFAVLVLLVVSGLERLLRTLRHGKAMPMA